MRDVLQYVWLLGTGRSSHLCAVTDEDGVVQIFDTRASVMANDDARVNCKQPVVLYPVRC